MLGHAATHVDAVVVVAAAAKEHHTDNSQSVKVNVACSKTAFGDNKTWKFMQNKFECHVYSSFMADSRKQQ